MKKLSNLILGIALSFLIGISSVKADHVPFEPPKSNDIVPIFLICYDEKNGSKGLEAVSQVMSAAMKSRNETMKAIRVAIAGGICIPTTSMVKVLDKIISIEDFGGATAEVWTVEKKDSAKDDGTIWYGILRYMMKKEGNKI